MSMSEQAVADLNRQQHSGQTHPHTCPNRGDGYHPDQGLDHGILRATATGWVCDYCDYTQPYSDQARRRALAQLSGARAQVRITDPTTMTLAVTRLLTCHRHHFAVVAEQQILLCSEMAVGCLLTAGLLPLDAVIAGESE